MNYTTTNLLQRSISKVFPGKSVQTVLEISFLLLLGIFAMAVHSKLRIPMHLPGKQGIIFIALVVTGRGISRLPFAGSIICTGSALMLLTMVGTANPFGAITYILLGGIMDLIYSLSFRYTERPWFLAIMSGIAWMFIPLFRLILSLFIAVPMNLFSSGIAYPFMTHLLFGCMGGLIGAGLLSLINIKK